MQIGIASWDTEEIMEKLAEKKSIEGEINQLVDEHNELVDEINRLEDEEIEVAEEVIERSREIGREHELIR